MNKQLKKKHGVITGRGIEWTDYTWNPISGCFHACQWVMPDGSVANCYAEDVAEKVAQAAYPHGFEYNYWDPSKLEEPVRVKQPSRIFVGSMADVFGHWVEAEHIEAVLDVALRAPQHTFQFLTKNPIRVQNFKIPDNCWIGASTPPDFMWNKPMSLAKRSKWLFTTMLKLTELQDRGIARTTWLSAEPLTINIIDTWKQLPTAIDWIVIGAASNGNTYYAPEEAFVRETVGLADELNVPVFYKGNMKSLDWAASDWREGFPTPKSAIVVG